MTTSSRLARLFGTPRTRKPAARRSAVAVFEALEARAMLSDTPWVPPEGHINFKLIDASNLYADNVGSTGATAMPRRDAFADYTLQFRGDCQPQGAP